MNGIWLYDTFPNTTSQGHIIEDIRFDRNTAYGISVYGRGNIIRNNLVVSTGGNSYNINPQGFYVTGPGNRVINNDVYETKEQTGGYAYGIYAFAADGLVVENNRVGNAAFTTGGNSNGIYIYYSNNVMVKDNTISKMNFGIYYDSNSGLYMNNLASGCPNAFTGGTPAGSTNHHN